MRDVTASAFVFIGREQSNRNATTPKTPPVTRNAVRSKLCGCFVSGVFISYFVRQVAAAMVSVLSAKRIRKRFPIDFHGYIVTQKRVTRVIGILDVKAH